MKSKLITAALIAAMGVSATALAKNDNSDKHKPLPPGLQKKAERGQELPPGWQHKLGRGDTLDRQVYRDSQVVARDRHDGTLTIRVEGKLIKVIEKSHEIVDILDSL